MASRSFFLRGCKVVDKNKKINGIPIQEIYQYINFGNLEVKGYPIIHDTLSDVNRKLNRYILKYELVGVI